MHRLGTLRTVPAPLLLRLVTVSMFGLKVSRLAHTKSDRALIISYQVAASSEREHGNLVALLDRAIVAIRQSAVDDLHPAGYYAQLLEHLAGKAQKRSRLPSPETPIVGGGSQMKFAGNDAQSQDGSLAHQTTQYPAANMEAVLPESWDDWLAFQFDPYLTNFGDTGFDEEFLFSSGFEIFPGPS